MEKPIVINAKECKECNVPKGWGHEIIFENNELYCGKLLVFKKGCNFSMHYHLIKDETWYVQEGEFLYRWIDTETGEVHEEQLREADGILFEVSTEHFDSDSYRVYRKWLDDKNV